MVTKKNIDKLVNFINQGVKDNLGDRLESIYLVGSYTKGKISLSRPDINWLLVHKEPVQDESRWELGQVLTDAIDVFINDFVVRPEPRPFKFSYPIRRGMDEVFVNMSIVSSATSSDEFKTKNNFIPEYVLEGYKQTRKLVFGKDILENIDFKVSREIIHRDAVEKIISHKVQLDRIPLAYHLDRDIDLIFNESLSHGKNLLYFGVELLMSEEELKEKKFLEIFDNKDNFLEFYKKRLPKTINSVQKILEAKEHYSEWKSNKERAREIYLIASNFSNILFGLINE